MQSNPTTLRASKRQGTHEAIADAAALLFSLRGFEAVTIDDVAQAANVGRQTVFNHFAVKEDLVFDLAAERRNALLAAVAGRSACASPLDAVRDWTLSWWQRVHTVEMGGKPDGGIFALVSRSAALRARRRELDAVTAGALTDVIEIEPWTLAHVIATALVAVDHAMFTSMMEHVAAGRRIEEVRQQVIDDGARAFDALERGLKPWPTSTFAAPLPSVRPSTDCQEGGR